MTDISTGSPQTSVNRRNGALLVAILVVAAGLRLWGLRWGLPDSTHLFSYHPDEYHSLRGLFSLVGGSLNPHFFNYGSLYLYLVAVAAVVSPGALLTGSAPWALSIEGLPDALRVWTLDARIVSVLAALVTVAAVYWLTRRVLANPWALLSAGFLAAMPLHVLHSHYGTVDVTQALFVTLSLLFSVRIVQEGGWKNYVWAGLAAGLAASTKYNGAVVIVAPLLATFLARPAPSSHRTPLRHQSVKLLSILLCAGVGFVATSPYTLLAWNEAKRGILFELRHIQVGEPLAILAEPSGLLFHIKNLLAPGVGPLLIMAAVGLVMVIAQRRRALYPLVVFVVIWAVMISVANVRYARYEVPLLPALAVLSAVPLQKLFTVGRLWRGVGYALIALCLAVGLMWSAQVSAGLATRGPHAPALATVLEQTPPKATVGLVQEPWFDIPPVDYCNGGQVIRSLPLWQQYRRPLRNIVVTGFDVRRLRETSPHTFVLSGFTYRDGLRGGDPMTVQFITQLLQQYQRIVRLGGLPLVAVPWEVASDWLYPWPEIDIYVRKQTN